MWGGVVTDARAMNIIENDDGFHAGRLDMETIQSNVARVIAQKCRTVVTALHAKCDVIKPNAFSVATVKAP